ncbi:unnamed protein product [Calicophoron daubneyi]|uniref:Uncharacterized protein n=1 Tax=Calicophoron daubneyi TaxID=300641 RepID=A0AAV2TTA5_CALDB
MPTTSEKQKPKKKKVSKNKRKRHRPISSRAVSKQSERSEKAVVYTYNTEEDCHACSPSYCRELTVKLLRCLNCSGDSKPQTSPSLLSGWTSDLVNLSLCRTKKPALNPISKTRADNKPNKTNPVRNSRQLKFLTNFKHFDRVEDYIEQYRRPKCLEHLAIQEKHSAAQVINLNAYFAPLTSNPANSRLKWLNGVSKSVHSRIMSGGTKPTRTLSPSPSRPGKSEQQKSFESLLSYVCL